MKKVFIHVLIVYSKELISNLTALTAFFQEACHKMGKTAREEIENRMCECKFVLEIPEIIPHI